MQCITLSTELGTYHAPQRCQLLPWPNTSLEKEAKCFEEIIMVIKVYDVYKAKSTSEFAWHNSEQLKA